MTGTTENITVALVALKVLLETRNDFFTHADEVEGEELRAFVIKDNTGMWAKAHEALNLQERAASPSVGAPPATKAQELKLAWTAWLEQYGVPISTEFVRLAYAIGAFTGPIDEYLLDQSADGLLKRIADYRTGYSCGYADGKSRVQMRDKDAAAQFFGFFDAPTTK